jgi:hypothetical protein
MTIEQELIDNLTRQIELLEAMVQDHIKIQLILKNRILYLESKINENGSV